MATTTTKTTPNPAEFFTTMNDGFTTAMKAGFDAQSHMLAAWSKAFGAQSPTMGAMGDMDTRFRTMALTAGDFARQTGEAIGEMVQENVAATTDLFGRTIERTMGPDAPTTVEDAFEVSQELARDGMELVRTATERTTNLARAQFEAIQHVAANGATTKTNGRRTTKNTK